MTVTDAAPLAVATLVGFVASSDLERSRRFYEGVLGLDLVEQDQFACVVRSGGTTVRITAVSNVVTAPYTVIGWEVDDIDRVVASLAGRGVVFLRYEGIEQDTAGIWTAPGGARVAWFSDPDGHTLSVTQHGAEATQG